MNENDKALQEKVNTAMDILIKDKGVVASTEVLLAIGVLSKAEAQPQAVLDGLSEMGQRSK